MYTFYKQRLDLILKATSPLLFSSSAFPLTGLAQEASKIVCTAQFVVCLAWRGGDGGEVGVWRLDFRSFSCLLAL